MEGPDVDLRSSNVHPLAILTAYVSATFNILQTIGAIVALSIEWSAPCDRSLQLWLFVLATRVCSRRLVHYIIKQRRRGYDDDGDWSALHKVRELLDVFGLIWFTIGNAWIFGSTTCRSTAPIIYYITLGIILSTYFVMLFPIVLAVVLLPFFCICFPCLAQFLINSQDQDQTVSEESLDLNSIPVITYKYGCLADQSPECAICLTEYDEDDELRILQRSGRHHFHKHCADPWLSTTPACPCCREHPLSHATKPVASPDTNPSTESNLNPNTESTPRIRRMFGWFRRTPRSQRSDEEFKDSFSADEENPQTDDVAAVQLSANISANRVRTQAAAPSHSHLQSYMNMSPAEAKVDAGPLPDARPGREAGINTQAHAHARNISHDSIMSSASPNAWGHASRSSLLPSA